MLADSAVIPLEKVAAPAALKYSLAAPAVIGSPPLELDS